jgi:16S rRNA (guanine527-N7)-methyltransferase
VKETAKEMLARGAIELGLHLSSAELGKFYRFAGELQKWSKKINLTAIKGDEEVAIKHFVDSLTLVKLVKGTGILLDIGSGGGFPAIPLKIVLHNLHVTSVDAVEKKILFQRQVARLLQLHGFEAVHARGEELAARCAGHYDWVVSRAFADIPTFAKIALPLIKENGRMLAMKGKGGREEADAAKKPLAEMGGVVSEIVEFNLPFTGDARSIIVMERVKE